MKDVGLRLSVEKYKVADIATKPRDKANEDLTITITRNTTVESIGRIDPKCILPVKE